MKLPLLISCFNDISTCLKQNKKETPPPKKKLPHKITHPPKKQKHTTKHPRKHHAVNPLLKSEKQERYGKRQSLCVTNTKLLC